MSIKGTSQELYVGKRNSTILTLFGNKKIVNYEDLKHIDYMYSSGTEIGFLNFVYFDSRKTRFEFGKNSNEKISRTIELIKENMPSLEIIEHKADDLKFYQRNLFTIIFSFVMGFPLGIIGLYLMWHYKKSYSTARVTVTFLALLFWGTCGYLSYTNYKTTLNNVDAALSNYQENINEIYSGSIQSNYTEDSQLIANDNSQFSEEENDTVFEVGDVYESNDVKIMYLNSGDYTVDNQFMQPESGNKYIFAEFSIENIGESDYSVGYASFKCYAGNTECKSAVVSSEGAMTIITSLSPGKNTKGKIFYEVPKDSENIEFEYETDVFTQEKIYFKYK